MKKKTGNVRFINAQVGKTCRKKEKKVTFSQAGPKGEQRPKGEQGPSNGYVANRTTIKGLDKAPVLPGQPKNRVVELTLPAGSYLINASTSVHRLGISTTEIACTLKGAIGTVSSSKVIASVNQQYYDVPLTATASYTNTEPGTVYLQCDPSGTVPLGAEGEANGGTMTATRVAELTGP